MIYPFLVRRAVFIWEFSPPIVSFTNRTFIYLFIYLFIHLFFIFLLYYVIVQWYKVLSIEGKIPHSL